MTRHRLSILAVFLLGAVARDAGADTDWLGARFGAYLHYDATYVDRRAPGGSGDDRSLTLVGLRLHAFGSRTWFVGYQLGLDLHAGATNPGGFAYQTDLYLVGFGARLGRHGMLGASAGIGASGAVGTMDDGVDLPVEAFAELNLGAHVRLMARARALWLAAAPARRDGAPTFGWTDEVDATFAIRLGRRYDLEYGRCCRSGNGYFVGVAYREAEGARYAGATVGYAVDIANP